jgi:hypothetical protein
MFHLGSAPDDADDHRSTGKRLREQREPQPPDRTHGGRLAGSPLQRVKVLEYVRRNKWKARWIDPNPGLVDYVESAQIIVPWKDHKAFLGDEENAARLAEQNRREGFGGSPVAEALQQVYESMGDAIRSYGSSASGSSDAFGRITARARDT